MTSVSAARIAACLLCAAALAGAGVPAAAQAPGGVGLLPSQQENQPGVPPPPAPAFQENLFGDWGGVRTHLSNLGINYTLDWTDETAGNISGGLKQGATTAYQVGLQIDMDWEKIAGIQGFSTHFAAVNRGGRNLSGAFIGDNVIQAQEIWGATFGTVVHGVWFYGEQKLLNGRIDAVLGRVFPGMDFAASPLYCNFMTLTICGHPRGLTAEQGFIDWPSNTWGGRVRVRPTPDTYVMSGIYASQPFPSGGISGFDWSTNKITGTVYANEVAWEPVVGPDRLPGHYKVGVAYDTTNFPDNYFDVFQTPYVLSGLPPRQDHSRTQIWVTFDQLLFRNGHLPNNGLTLLGAYVHDTPRNSLYQSFVWGGLLYSGFWRTRPADQIGLGITYYQISPSLSQTESLEQAFDLPPSYPYGVQNHAMVFELNYQIAAYRGIIIQPEFEFFLRPGGVSPSRVPNAAVLGLKTHVNF
ncbi:MAG: carbohydrate porin [Acetobacteraceae bacterium]|nr:carbohydrate porin [Acetobacteraceae bacterium]